VSGFCSITQRAQRASYSSRSASGTTSAQHRPCLRPLSREIAFPSGVLGPVDFWALAWLARLRNERSDLGLEAAAIIGLPFFVGMADAGRRATSRGWAARPDSVIGARSRRLRKGADFFRGPGSGWEGRADRAGPGFVSSALRGTPSYVILG